MIGRGGFGFTPEVENDVGLGLRHRKICVNCSYEVKLTSMRYGRTELISIAEILLSWIAIASAIVRRD